MQDTKLRPSEMVATLTQASAPSAHPEVPSDGPQIVEFLDLSSTTTQTNSSVELDRPIFQPYPHVLKFPQYEPFGVYEQTLFFRNNDSVSRRIRVMPPESPFFEVIGPRSPVGLKELEHGKIGPGMEVVFIVKFRPQEVKDYKVELVCVTEREKFLVPVSHLSLPYSCSTLLLSPAPARCCCGLTILCTQTTRLGLPLFLDLLFVAVCIIVSLAYACPFHISFHSLDTYRYSCTVAFHSPLPPHHYFPTPPC